MKNWRYVRVLEADKLPGGWHIRVAITNGIEDRSHFLNFAALPGYLAIMEATESYCQFLNSQMV